MNGSGSCCVKGCGRDVETYSSVGAFLNTARLFALSPNLKCRWNA